MAFELTLLLHGSTSRATVTSGVTPSFKFQLNRSAADLPFVWLHSPRTLDLVKGVLAAHQHLLVNSRTPRPIAVSQRCCWYRQISSAPGINAIVADQVTRRRLHGRPIVTAALDHYQILKRCFSRMSIESVETLFALQASVAWGKLIDNEQSAHMELTLIPAAYHTTDTSDVAGIVPMQCEYLWMNAAFVSELIGEVFESVCRGLLFLFSAYPVCTLRIPKDRHALEGCVEVTWKISSHEARCNRSIQCTPMREDMRLQLQSSSHPNIRIMTRPSTNIEHFSLDGTQ
ncbi:hypothetical protein NA56DRAFT_752775 [Hyaloscypha hepaticicola]|uniref:Uncharacterized protein n=1 Tax=Hyaloscypha hepaticicola TaxID=2082293 RepID=A0A2J6PRY9_9HELO|nr:hypothetical protein NA56DRAFT_752775 [Hyaloscypha hepaticicola]